MIDRLAEIKATAENYPHEFLSKEIDWLITEVERLREALKIVSKSGRMHIEEEHLWREESERLAKLLRNLRGKPE